VTSALSFDTPDCHVTGSCDLYTTKAAGTDKKLYKNIDKSLEAQHVAQLQFGKSLSPPHLESMSATLNLSRSSPFGPLSEIASRRTYAYLIATLNASHPDYDFSNVLRPADFKRERNLRRVMNNIDTTIQSVRPASAVFDGSLPRSVGSPHSPTGSGIITSPVWGAQTWAMLNKQMSLQNCTIFSYQPADNPFEEEEGAIWALHYLFFNKTEKRVAYLYVRAVPVVSHSPRMRPRRGSSGVFSSSLKRGFLSLDDSGANKRARYWLGDQYAARATTSDDDSDDDGLEWNRDADGDMGLVSEDYDEEDNGDDDDEVDEDEDADGPTDDTIHKSPVRGVSEDIAARMELEL
jgi:AP-1 complex subunit sigma 1/2